MELVEGERGKGSRKQKERVSKEDRTAGGGKVRQRIDRTARSGKVWEGAGNGRGGREKACTGNEGRPTLKRPTLNNAPAEWSCKV